MIRSEEGFGGLRTATNGPRMTSRRPKLGVSPSVYMVTFADNSAWLQQFLRSRRVSARSVLGPESNKRAAGDKQTRNTGHFKRSSKCRCFLAKISHKSQLFSLLTYLLPLLSSCEAPTWLRVPHSKLRSSHNCHSPYRHVDTIHNNGPV